MLKDTIVYVGGFKLPDKNAAAQRVINNSKIFRSLGYKVVLIGVDDDLKNVEEPRFENHEGFDTLSFAYPLGTKKWINYTLGNQKMLDYVDSIGGSLHSVVCYNYPAYASKKLFAIAAKHGAATVSDLTEWYDTDMSNPRGIIKTIDTYARMKVVGPGSDAIITTSPHLERFYEARRKPQVNLPTLYDSEKIADLGFSYKGASSLRTFVYAGSPGSTNGKNSGFSKDRLDLVVEALSKVSQTNNAFVLKVYGLDENNYRKSMPSHHSILDLLGDSIEFLGRRPHSEILQAFTEADYTTFLRTEDRLTLAGFPSKFAESITCGTPVVCSAVANLDMYMTEGKNSFELDPLDLDKSASVFKRCIELPNEKLDQIHENCLTNRQFDYRNFEAPVKTFFQKINREYGLTS